MAPTKTNVYSSKAAVAELDASWTLAAAPLFAFVLSTAFLVQPFIWRNYPIDEIALAWLDILRARILVALSVAVALIGCSRLPSNVLTGWPSIVLAVMTGAFVGEGFLFATGDSRAAQDAPSFFAHILQWTVSTLCLVVLYVLSRSVLRAAEHASEERRARVQLLQVAASTQLTALKRQIEPHFFFNALATVRRLNRTDAAKGARLMADLLQYMRDMLARSGDQSTTLGQEIGLVVAYLRVCEVRMGGRLHFTIDAPDEILTLDFPALLLATLVENAVKHGIEPLPEGGEVLISARHVDERLAICVEDSGGGFKTPSGSGLGLANVRARLRATYGAGASLTFEQRAPIGVIARVVIPMAAK